MAKLMINCPSKRLKDRCIFSVAIFNGLKQTTAELSPNTLKHRARRNYTDMAGDVSYFTNITLDRGEVQWYEITYSADSMTNPRRQR